MGMPASGCTKPAPGVMATSPTTAPVAAPSSEIYHRLVVVLVDRQEDRGRQNIEKEGVKVEALYTIEDLMRLRQ